MGKKAGNFTAIFLLGWLFFCPKNINAQDKYQALLVTLDSGWRYQPGDDPSWAKPNMDDGKWEPVDPSKDIHVFFRSHSRPVLGWLRTRFEVPVNWADQSMAITVIQSVASEIYLDGKRIANFGIIDSTGRLTREHDPHLVPIPIRLSAGSHSLAVRVGGAAHTPYTTLFELPNPLFVVELKPFDAALDEYRHIHASDTGFSAVMIGINLMIFIFHGAFFMMNRQQAANLFLSLSGMVYMIGSLLQIAYYLHTPNHGDRYYLGNLVFLLFETGNALAFLSIHYFLERRRDVIFWLLAGYFMVSIFFNLFWYDKGWRMGGAFFQILSWINIFRICMSARRQGKKGARVFALGTLVSILFFILFLLQGAFDSHSDYLRNLNLLRQLTYMFFWLGITGAVSAFLAWDFSMTSRQLARKLAEVGELSDRNIAVEKEKQEILSMQNQTLEHKVLERTEALNKSLDELRSTQAQLIQSEKMASLGELTAGIAHEIQNPLNFVNNFSEVNTELAAELRDSLDQGDVGTAKGLSIDIAANQLKILEHGKRADTIVKSMLQHSRTSSGEKEPTDINALCDECLRLAYHGMRARDKSFQASYTFNPDPLMPKIPVLPQDIGRVLLNLLNNAFQAVQEKARMTGEGYQPMVTVSINRNQLGVEIRVEDNGPGIPENIRDKIFQPFFTTKPTGQGTGLGLSLSYDIVKAHGGKLELQSQTPDGAVFIIHLAQKDKYA